MGSELSCGSDRCAQYCGQNKTVQHIIHHSNASYSDPALTPGKPIEQAAGKGLSKTIDADTFTLLASVKVFQDVPESKLSSLIAGALPKDYSPGQEVIRQGEDGHEFFFIKSGDATVIVDNMEVATLHVGDYFGEQALLRDSTRNATIVASTSMSTLKITRAQFQSFGLH
eukprot:TRINITY_DN52552_c0_g1_i1.p1 TRINITY_DN52552_c0_g1~~TRINITY_DN52552_c0_g1_i1.p1  ORF type:complete len:170 (-),score=16.12 TRINITY_DN52552_c0_g1_i1:26-535(-)